MNEINDLLEVKQVGDTFKGFAQVKDSKDGVATNGSPFFDITVQKKSKTLMAKLWENKFDGYKVAQLKELFKAGNIIFLSGRIGEYKGNLQISVDTFHLAEEGEAQIGDYIMTAPEPINTMQAEFEGFIEAIETPILKDITKSIYEDNKIAFTSHPAGKAVHHDFYGGLLFHTLSMTRIAKNIADQYPQINRSLLYAGVMLHDMGKVVELGFDSFVPTYTEVGSFIGHITIINMLIDRKVQQFAKEKKYTRKDFDKAIQLMSVVSSHHGKLEFGSPVTPMLLEAEVLHHIDMLDSRINIITKGLADKTEGEFHKIYPMGAFYKPIAE